MHTSTAAIQHLNLSAIFGARTSVARPIAEQCQHCATRNVCEACASMGSLSGEQKNQLFRTHRITRGQHLFYAGDKLDTLYLVKSGLFKTYLNSEGGDERVMGFYLPGELLGADAIAQQVHNLSAVALETSTVCATPVMPLETTFNQYSTPWLLKQVYQEVFRERHILMISSRKYTAESRIACFLMDMSARNAARGYSEREFKLNMPHRDIAHYLDMALETVSRVFTRLQDNGLLVIERPYVKIIDIEKLRAVAQIQLPLAERLSA